MTRTAVNLRPIKNWTLFFSQEVSREFSDFLRKGVRAQRMNNFNNFHRRAAA